MAYESHYFHPLLVPSIINEVISYTNVAELKVCRLVCTTWDSEARKYMRNKTSVVFTTNDQIREFIKNHKRSVRKRCQCFAFNFQLGPDLDLEEADVQIFFDHFGESIKSLHFNKVNWTSADVRTILGEKVPNLEELILDPNPEAQLEHCRLFPPPASVPVEVPGGGSYKHICPTIPILHKLKHLKMNWELSNVGSPMLKELTLMVPNIEKLTAMKPVRKNRFELTIDDMLRSGRQFIANRTESMPEAVVEDLPFLSSHIILSQLVVSLTGPRFSKLTDLDVHMIGSDSAVKKLQSKNLPLKKLDLSPTPNVQLSTLCILFSSLKATLTHLRLKYHPNVPFAHMIPSGDELKKLQYVSLVGYKGSLVILEQLPELKSLILRRVNLEHAVLHSQFAAINFEERGPYHLKTFEVYHDSKNYQFCNPYPNPVMARLTEACPNLTRLRLEGVNNDNLRVIFKKLPKLEELVLVDGLFTDLGICGMEPKQHCSENILTAVNFSRTDAVPCVASLKKLRRLELESPYLTDFSISNGICECETLRELVLSSFAITDVSIRKIVDEMQLSYLQTLFCSKITQEVKEYAQEKMKGYKVSINEYNGPIDKVEIVRFLKKNDTAKVVVRRLDDPEKDNQELLPNNNMHGVVLSKPPIPPSGRTTKRTMGRSSKPNAGRQIVERPPSKYIN